jgi:uncharacterized protein with WD repeat
MSKKPTSDSQSR